MIVKYFLSRESDESNIEKFDNAHSLCSPWWRMNWHGQVKELQ